MVEGKAYEDDFYDSDYAAYRDVNICFTCTK